MIKIRKLKPADTRAVATLISQTYSTFNISEGTKSATRAYIDCYGPSRPIEDLERHFSRTPNSYVAIADSEVIGVIRGTADRIINLYVDERYHRRGIATKLMRRFEQECIRLGASEIKISGSLYAIPFYTTQGYKRSTGMRTIRGLSIQPMKKILKR